MPLHLRHLLILSLGFSTAASAVETGWKQSFGTYTYGDPSNWVNGVINNIFDDSLVLQGSLLLAFDNTYTTSGDLVFSYQQGYPTFNVGFAAQNAPGTLVLGGDIHFTPVGFEPGSRPALFFGDIHATSINLGGLARTFEVGAGSLVRTDEGSVVLNGSLIKTGGGNLQLQGTNTISAIEFREGILTLGTEGAFGSGPITFTSTARLRAETDAFGSTAITNPLNIEANVFFGGKFDGIDGRSFELSGPVSLGNAPRTFTIGHSPGLSTLLSGVISGDATARLSVTSESSTGGTLALSGNNTFSGGLKVIDGGLQLGHKNALGTGGLELAQGAQLTAGSALTGANAVPNPVTITGDVTLGGFELSGPISLGTATRRITTKAGTMILSGSISGTPDTGIVVGGVGAIVLKGVNTFGGGVTLHSGTLTLGNRLALGSGKLTLAGGLLTLLGDYLGAAAIPNAIALRGDVQFGVINVTSTRDNEFSGPIDLGSTGGKITSADGRLVFSGVISGDSTAPLRLASNGDRIFLKAANTYSGGTILENFVASGPQIRLSNPASFGTGPVTVLSPSVLNADVALTGANAIPNSFNLSSELCVIGYPLELSGSIDLADVNRTIVSGNSGFHISGVIKNGGLIFDTNARVTVPLNTRLSGVNTYTGPTEVRAGTLIIGGNAPVGAPGVLGNATTPVVLGGNTSYGFASIQTWGPFTVWRDLSVIGQSISIGGYTADVSTFAGNVVFNTPANSNISLIAGSGGTVEFNGLISGAASASVAKTGAGTVILRGANTYAGTTTVSAGTLLVSNATGSGTGSGAVTVTAGELGGTGTITGSVTVGNAMGIADAILSPGASIGTLTAGGLSLLGDAVFKFELNSSLQTSDLLIANGPVSLGNAKLTALDLASAMLLPGATFVVIENRSSSPTTGEFLGLSESTPIQIGSNFFLVDYHAGLNGDGLNNDVVLRATSVPEPSTLALLLPGAFLLAGRRRAARGSVKYFRDPAPAPEKSLRKLGSSPRERPAPVAPPLLNRRRHEKLLADRLPFPIAPLATLPPALRASPGQSAQASSGDDRPALTQVAADVRRLPFCSRTAAH